MRATRFGPPRLPPESAPAPSPPDQAEPESSPRPEPWDEWLFGKPLDGNRLPHNLADYLTAAFTFVLAVFAIFAWRDSQDTSRLQLFQQRPWLHIAKAEVIERDDDAGIGMRFTVGNTGRTPGIGAYLVYGELKYFDRAKLPELLKALYGQCDANRNDTDIHEDDRLGEAVFPNQQIFDEINFPDEDWAAFAKALKAGAPNYGVMGGCIDYVTQQDHHAHQTRFGYLLKIKRLPTPREKLSPQDVEISTPFWLENTAD